MLKYLAKLLCSICCLSIVSVDNWAYAAADPDWKTLLQSATTDYQQRLYEAAEDKARKCEKLLASERPLSKEYADSLALLGRVLAYRVTTGNAKPQETEDVLKQALSTYQKLEADTGTAQNETLKVLADFYIFSGRYVAAQNRLKSVVGTDANNPLLSKPLLKKTNQTASDQALMQLISFIDRNTTLDDGTTRDEGFHTAVLSTFAEVKEKWLRGDREGARPRLNKLFAQYPRKSDPISPSDGLKLGALTAMARRLDLSRDLAVSFILALNSVYEKYGASHLAANTIKVETALYLQSLGGDNTPVLENLKMPVPEDALATQKAELASTIASHGGLATCLAWMADVQIAAGTSLLACDKNYDQVMDIARFANLIQSAIRKHKLAIDTHTRSLGTAELFHLLGYTTIARSKFRDAAEESRTLYGASSAQFRECALALARCNLEQGNFADSIEQAEACLQASKSNDKLALEARKLICLASANQFANSSGPGRNALLNQTLKKARTLVKQVESDVQYKRELPFALSIFANLKSEAGDRKAARQNFERVSSLLSGTTEPDLRQLLAESQSSLSELHILDYKTSRSESDFRKTEMSILESLKLMQNTGQIDDRLDKLKTTVNLAYLYHIAGKKEATQAQVKSATDLLQTLAGEMQTKLLFSDQYLFMRRLEAISARLTALADRKNLNDFYQYLVGLKGLLIEAKARDGLRIRMCGGEQRNRQPMESVSKRRATLASFLQRKKQLNADEIAALAQKLRDYEIAQTYQAKAASLNAELLIANEHLQALLRQNELLKQALAEKLKQENAKNPTAPSKPMPISKENERPQERTKDQAERAAALRAMAFENLEGQRKMGTLENFRKVLNKNETLVDFYLYAPVSSSNERMFDQSSYCAIALTSDAGPEFIDLGPAGQIDSSIRKWLSFLEQSGNVRKKRDTIVQESSERTPEADDSAHDVLRTKLWTPISTCVNNLMKRSNREHSAEETVKLIICPDGELARIPWSLLANSDRGKILVSQTDSARELYWLRKVKRPENQSRKALLVGGINFGANSLHHSEKEVNALQNLLSGAGYHCSLLKGEQPTRTAVRRDIETIALCHFATHGFFSDFRNDLSSSNLVRSMRTMPRSLRTDNTVRLIADQNPFLTSGICLAQREAKDDNDEDGVGLLTAEDIVGLDLQNCDLITLSACETGRGNQYAGQGVLGLRSAIMSAGARSVLMSLWSVDDEATSELMQRFYKKLLSEDKSMTKARALEEAQEEIKNMPGKNWKHPFYWAAWILCGEAW